MSKLSKLKFCYSITGSLNSFLTLVADSRKLRLSKSSPDLRSNDVKKNINLKLKNGVRKLYYRVYSGDLDIFYEVFYRDAYAMGGKPLPPDPVIIDIGANIGIASLYLLNEYPGAKCVLVEPDPENIELLKKNLEEEIRTAKVEVVQSAIMDYDGTIGFRTEQLKFNSHVEDSEEGLQVESMTISSLLSKFSIDQVDLMKIDVEGAEKFIFNSNYEWLLRVRNLFIEIHDDISSGKIIDLLRSLGFEITLKMENNAGEKLIFAKKLILK